MVVDDAWQAWRDEVIFAEKFVADSPDLGIRGTMRDGDTIVLREVLVHMIEEYARHCATPTCCEDVVAGWSHWVMPAGSGGWPWLALGGEEFRSGGGGIGRWLVRAVPALGRHGDRTPRSGDIQW